MLVHVDGRACSVCKKMFPLTAEFFHKGSAVNGGYVHTCKSCAVSRSRAYYANKVRGTAKSIQKIRKEVARNRATKAAIVAERGGKCEQCGGEFPPVVFDFHHPNNDRKGDLPPSKYLAYGVARGREAVKNLLMLCANCHRIAHWGVNKYGSESVEEVTVPC